VRLKANRAGLICRTYQCYRRRWLPNTEWSNSRRRSRRRRIYFPQRTM